MLGHDLGACVAVVALPPFLSRPTTQYERSDALVDRHVARTSVIVRRGC